MHNKLSGSRQIWYQIIWAYKSFNVSTAYCLSK